MTSPATSGQQQDARMLHSYSCASRYLNYNTGFTNTLLVIVEEPLRSSLYGLLQSTVRLYYICVVHARQGCSWCLPNKKTLRVKPHRCIRADYCRPEVAIDVISGQKAYGVEFVPLTKFGDPSSNRLAGMHRCDRQTDRQTTDRAMTIAHPMHIACIGGLKTNELKLKLNWDSYKINVYKKKK